MLVTILPATAWSEPYDTWVRLEETNDSLSLYGFSDGLLTHALRAQGRFALSMQPSSRQYVGFVLGQEIYTPQEITPVPENDELTGLQLDRQTQRALFRHWLAHEGARDRPYSGWLYAGPSFDIELSHNRVLLGRAGLARLDVEVQLGVTGPWSQAGRFQTAMHRATRALTNTPYPRDPQGWEYTAHAGAETQNHFGVLVDAHAEHDIANLALAPSLDVSDATLGLRTHLDGRARLGSVRDDASLGGTLELGYLGREPYGPDGAAVGGTISSFALYAHVGGALRVIAFDRHLDDRPFESTPAERPRKAWGASSLHGLVLRLRPVEFEYAVLFRVRELDPPLSGTFHHAGVIRVTGMW